MSAPGPRHAVVSADRAAGRSYARPVTPGALTLDLSTDGVPELLADFEMLVLWEALRRARGGAALPALAAGTGVTSKAAKTLLDRLVALGMATVKHAGRTRTPRYVAAPGPLVVTFDPTDPKTALRLAAARMALIGHLKRMGTTPPRRAARKGASWRRDSVAVLPLEGRAIELVKAGLDRIDACLEAATEVSDAATVQSPDRRPMYRVHVTVEPVERAALALPVVLLMERNDATARNGRATRQAATRLLSAREREVALALAAGRTKREVAKAMGLAFATVNTLAVRAYRKLGIKRRAQLANALNGHR